MTISTQYSIKHRNNVQKYVKIPSEVCTRTHNSTLKNKKAPHRGRDTPPRSLRSLAGGFQQIWNAPVASLVQGKLSIARSLGQGNFVLLYQISYQYLISVVNKQYRTKEFISLGQEKTGCYIRYFVISDLFITSFHCTSLLFLDNEKRILTLCSWCVSSFIEILFSKNAMQLRRVLCNPLLKRITETMHCSGTMGC